MCTSVVVAVSQLPSTHFDVDPRKIPVANEWAIVYLGSILVVFIAVLQGFSHSAFDPVTAPKLHFGWKNSWPGRALP